MQIKDAMSSYILFLLPEQVTDKNDFRSQNSIQFMIESFNRIKRKQVVSCNSFFGNQTKVVAKLIDEFSFKTL